MSHSNTKRHPSSLLALVTALLLSLTLGTSLLLSSTLSRCTTHDTVAPTTAQTETPTTKQTTQQTETQSKEQYLEKMNTFATLVETGTNNEDALKLNLLDSTLGETYKFLNYTSGFKLENEEILNNPVERHGLIRLDFDCSDDESGTGHKTLTLEGYNHSENETKVGEILITRLVYQVDKEAQGWENTNLGNVSFLNGLIDGDTNKLQFTERSTEDNLEFHLKESDTEAKFESKTMTYGSQSLDVGFTFETKGDLSKLTEVSYTINRDLVFEVEKVPEK